MSLTTDIRVRIEHADGRNSTFEALASEEDYQFDKEDLATISALRHDVSNANVTEDEDEVYLDSYDDSAGAYEQIFGGVLRDVERSGSKSRLVVASFEQYSRDAEPTPGDERWQGVADDTIVNDAINSVDELSAGTIGNANNDLTFIFSHTSPAKKLRTVADATPAFIRYNSDKTVDYSAAIGSDKTATTLSPSSQNVVEKFSVNRVGGEDRKTHLRMLGAGEGEGQVTATVVASNYSSGEREKWGTRINKDITDATTLESHGQQIVDELYEEFVEVDTVVIGERVELGDTYHLKYDKEDLDANLEAVEVSRVIDGDGVRYDVTFASRNQARETQHEKEIKDVDRYNKAFEGTNVTNTASGGRQPVGPNHNYEFDFYYPDEIEYEHRVKLQVKGLPYRAYSAGAAAGGNPHQHEIDLSGNDTAVNAEFGQPEYQSKQSGSMTIDNQAYWDILSFDVPDTVDTGFGVVTVYPGLFEDPDPNNDDKFDIRVFESATGNHWPDIDGVTHRIHHYENDTRVGATILIPVNLSGASVTIQMHKSYSGSNEIITWGYLQTAGQHTHDLHGVTTSKESGGDHSHPPEAGIIETFNGTRHWPEACDVLVNGTSLGVSMGDGYGDFERTVDLSGMLSPGQFNRIEITSDSLGHVQASLDCDLYRQVNGNG